MANFYAKYPASTASSSAITTVQGEGTAGTPVGGLLTVQGDPAGTPVPISGNITASSASVGPTGSAVPIDGDYVGLNNGGTLIGAIGDSAGRQIVAGAGTAGTAAGGVVSVQGVGGGTALPVSGTVAATQSGTWTVQPGNTANSTPWLATIAQGGNSATVSGGGALKVDASASTQPVSGTVAVTQSTSPWVSNISQFGGSNVATGTGTGGAGVPRVTVSSDSTLTSVGTVSTVTSVTNVAAQATWTTAAAVFQAEGSIAFGSITNAYQTIFTPSAATKILQMRNNTNAAISVSFDAGTTLNYVLDSGDAVSLDLLANGLVMSTTAIQIKYTVGAPTSGSFRVNGGH